MGTVRTHDEFGNPWPDGKPRHDTIARDHVVGHSAMTPIKVEGRDEFMVTKTPPLHPDSPAAREIATLRADLVKLIEWVRRDCSQFGNPEPPPLFSTATEAEMRR